MEAWIGVIGALGGVIVTALLALLRSSVEFRRQKDWERDSIVRARLEDLYSTISDVHDGYMSVFHHTTMRVEYGKEPSDQVAIPVERMRMLSRFYAPELDESLQFFEESYQLFSDALAATFTDERPIKKERQRLLGELFRAHKRVGLACDQLMSGTVEVAQGLSVARKPSARRGKGQRP